MSKAHDLRVALRACESEKISQRDFEDACIEALNYLFVPPLNGPLIKPRASESVVRRDAIYGNRNHYGVGNWVQLYKELAARMIRFEFRSCWAGALSAEEIIQARKDLDSVGGRLSLVCTNLKPESQAFIQRHAIYRNEKKVILFITPSNLMEMVSIKERNDDPSDLILDFVELIYVETSDDLGVPATEELQAGVPWVHAERSEPLG